MSKMPEPVFPHSIPPDDFKHIESMDCDCHPEARAVPGVSAAVCHRRIMAEPLEADTLPEEWEK